MENKIGQYIAFSSQNYVDSSSNILSLHWSDTAEINQTLSAKFLKAVEGLTQNIDVNQSTTMFKATNLILQEGCEHEATCSRNLLGMKLQTSSSLLRALAVERLTAWLPTEPDSVSSSNAMVVVLGNCTTKMEATVTIDFPLTQKRKHNHKVICVQWLRDVGKWEPKGCEWTHTDDDHAKCVCEIAPGPLEQAQGRRSGRRVVTLSALMSRGPVDIPGLVVVSSVGLGVSICSLIVFLAIEGLLWKMVAKTKLSHFRHTALVNISLFLLLANCVFLMSFLDLPEPFCLVSVLAKHFLYLAMFFWMLCLSIVLLHKIIFMFQPLRAQVFFILSAVTGYVCPLLTVAVAYVYYDILADGSDPSFSYHDPETCWLVYNGMWKGSLLTFVVPVGVITVTNLFSIVIVSVTLMRPAVSSEGKVDEKDTAKSVLRVIVILSPIFGVTWALGFGVFLLDVYDGTAWMLVNYAFTILNTLQVSATF